MDLIELQREVAFWTIKNFKNRELWQPVMGVAEEAGELCHATLKMSQGIRGSKKKHLDEAKDAIGDVVIYLADVCNQYGFSLHECIEDTWDKVKQRNWKSIPPDPGEKG